MSKIIIKLDDKTFSTFVPKSCANALFLELCHSAIWNPQSAEDREEMDLPSDTEPPINISITESDCMTDNSDASGKQKKKSADIPVSHGKDMTKEKPKRYKGFLHLICEKCGKVIKLNAQKPISEFTCHSCGTTTPLEGLAPMRLTCECGKKWRYWTNSYDELLEVNCVACGSPIVAQLNKDGEYETLKNRS